MPTQSNNNNKLEFAINPEVGKGVYANLALITHSDAEFILDFAAMLPGLQKANVASRVVMHPMHAKRLMLALQENIYKYEQQFGKIQLPEQQKGTIAPFSTGQGEA